MWELVKMEKLTLVIPSEQWFFAVAHYEREMLRVNVDLRTCLTGTLDLLITHARQNPKAPLYPAVLDYHLYLTRKLMQESQDTEAIAAVVDASSHFYEELIEFFKIMSVQRYQVASMRFKSWLGDDVVVTVQQMRL